jgi:pimeloyl-ACP methyl ester carboxylesterase
MNQIFETALGKVEFRITGQGIPVLFVHGGHSNCNETLFHKGFDPNEFHLINPSRPGYGKTPLLIDNSPAVTAALFIALLDELNIDSVILVGISAGGLTAIQIAADYPDRVNKLILISAVSKKWPEPDSPLYKKGNVLFGSKMQKFTWKFFTSLYNIFPGLMARILFKSLSSARPVKISEDEIEEIKELIHIQKSSNGFIPDLHQQIYIHALIKIKCPTLVMHGKYDKIVPLEHAYHSATAIRNSTLKIYDHKWGHLLWLGNESKDPIRDALIFIHKKDFVMLPMSSPS